MKKVLLLLLIIFVLTPDSMVAQGGLLKKVAKSMTDELLGKSPDNNSKPKAQPEPACECDQAELILDLGGKLQLDYTEITISILNDGRMLVSNRAGNQFYIVKDGVTQGPFNPGDSKIAEFEPADEENGNIDAFIKRNSPYISKTGDKLLITFNGKTYGPYSQINEFVVSQSLDKFAAMIIENVVVTEDEGEKMDKAIKNAKTDQEKMDLAMQFAQNMQEKMISGGGPSTTLPSLVTNIPDVTFDFLNSRGGTLNGKVKYDDILFTSSNEIYDLNGKSVMTINSSTFGKDLFLNTNNTKYASYSYGTLTFSDNTTMAELFSPHLDKVNGQVYLAYMYYSPKKNSIMQCKIPF